MDNSLFFQMNQNKLPLRSVDPRLISRGTPQDFTPAFADFSRQMPGGHGAPVSYSNSYTDQNTQNSYIYKNLRCFHKKKKKMGLTEQFGRTLSSLVVWVDDIPVDTIN